MKGTERSMGYRGTFGTVAVAVALATLAMAPQGARAACVGDCDNNGTVTIDEVITLVDINLGTQNASACTSGIPSGSTVTVATNIQAVNSALHGCGGGAAFCGDGITQSGEECDPGPGTCIGGPNAGTSCTAENQCPGDGVCRDGIKAGWGCSSNDDCPNSSCVHCKTFDKTVGNFDPTDGIPDDCGTYSASCGCASNCTFEKAVNITLIPGNSLDGTTIAYNNCCDSSEGKNCCNKTSGDPAHCGDLPIEHCSTNSDCTVPGFGVCAQTSGIIVNAPALNVGIPFGANTTRQLIIGKEKDGKIPGVLKKATNNTIGIDVLNGMACICLRPIVFRTCGGTLWEKDGKPSTNCSEGYTAGDGVCPTEKPCTFAYGPANSGEGEVGCNGLDGVDVSTTQDSGGGANVDCDKFCCTADATNCETPSHACSGNNECTTPGFTSCVINPRCKAGPVVTTRSGTGGPGSTVLGVTTELGFTLKPCTGTAPEYGDDHKFCTDDDPKEGRNALPQILTTGTASSTVENANETDASCNNEGIILCPMGNECPVGQPCQANNVGPYTAQGSPLSCSGLASDPPNVAGGGLGGGFPDLNAPQIGDIVVTSTQVVAP